MMKQQIALLAFAAIYQIVLVEASWISISCALKNLPSCSRYYYDGIDSFLMENLKTENVDDIMKAIEDWIQRESSRTLTNKDVHRLKALVQLHDLVSIEGPGMCTSSSGRILQKNDLAVGEAISKLSPGEIPRRRIERLINHYATQFLRDCDHEVMVEKVTQMDSVKKIIDGYITSRAREDITLAFFQPKLVQSQSFIDYSPHEASKFAKNLKGIRPEDPAIIHRLLEKLATDNYDALVKYLRKVEKGDSKVKVVDGNSVFKIYRKYVGKPCEEFVEKVESSFGNKWALKQSKKIHKRLNTEKPLYANLTYYYGCRLLLHKEEKLIKGLKKLIQKQY